MRLSIVYPTGTLFPRSRNARSNSPNLLVLAFLLPFLLRNSLLPLTSNTTTMKKQFLYVSLILEAVTAVSADGASLFGRTSGNETAGAATGI